MALWVGAHGIAREAAMEGAARYPAHSELQKMAYILGPPKVIKTQSPSAPVAQGDMAWLKNHWQAYRGKWVALRGGELLAEADSLDGIVEQIGSIKNTGIMVTPIW